MSKAHPLASGDLPVRVSHVGAAHSHAARVPISAFRPPFSSRTLACSGSVSLREENLSVQMEKHLDPTQPLHRHFLGAPYLAGTVVGTKCVLKTHSVQSPVRTAGLGQTRPRELLLRFNWGGGRGGELERSQYQQFYLTLRVTVVWMFHIYSRKTVCNRMGP